MRRRDESDIVHPAFLQLQHHFGQSLVRDLVLSLLLPGLRDLVILAVNAAEVAVSEKDVPGAVRSAQARLFAEVRRVRGNDRQLSGITRGYLVIQAIIATVLRADRAGTKKLFKRDDALFQLILRQEC